MTVFRQIARGLLSRLSPAERLLIRGAANRCATSCPGEVTPFSLTFDDGPHPEFTPPVLDALDKAGWTGTFFLVGRDAAAHPELVREIVRRGHEIGNHSYLHTEPHQTNARQLIEEVRQTEQLLHELTQQTVTLMRPPKGHLNISKVRTLWGADQNIILWSIDPRDFAMSSTAVAHGWAERFRPTIGDIVLLHDRLPYAAEIVTTLAQRGGQQLQSVGISCWLKRPRTDVSHSVPAAGGASS